MGEIFKKFFQRNAYQFVAAFITAILTLVGAYVSLQLWQQSTNFSIQAQGRDISDIRTLLPALVSRNEFVELKGKIDSMDKKIDILISR